MCSDPTTFCLKQSDIVLRYYTKMQYLQIGQTHMQLGGQKLRGPKMRQSVQALH